LRKKTDSLLKVQQGPLAAKGWWYARFRIKWPEGQEPFWHIDLLLANGLIAPILHKFGSEITLWRFHRRAMRDDEGHQFSFIIYTTPDTAGQIFGALKSDIMLRKLKRAGFITRDIYDDTNTIMSSDIAATSDASWAPVIKKTWPFFIMGSCRMWLSLVQEIAGDVPDQKKSLPLRQLIAHYGQVDETVKALWREQGCHSLLHHLNALFGYEPVIIREAHLRRF
jgi:hypothetical protein